MTASPRRHAAVIAMGRALVAMIAFALASRLIERPARIRWLEVVLIGAVIFVGSVLRTGSERQHTRPLAKEALIWALVLFVPIAFLALVHA